MCLILNGLALGTVLLGLALCRVAARVSQNPQTRNGARVAVEAWLARLKCDYPATYHVPPIPQEAQAHREPFTELVEMMGPDRVILSILPMEDTDHATP